MSDKHKISVVIPIYKNIEMVMRNLKHNMKYIEHFEIILVDDDSREGIAKKIKTSYPKVKVIENEENKGFAPTVNIGVEAAQGDLVILMGSDVRFLKPLPGDLISQFKKHRNLFAISFKQREKNNSSVGKNYIYFARGFPNHGRVHDSKRERNAWADGGASIVRKEYFHDLGGFNEIYAPFYWEDIDLSYRAYSRGWYVEFDPRIFVEHHHESTIGKLFTDSYIKTIAYRNQFIFTWTNITDKEMWLRHVLLLPYYMFYYTIRGDIPFVHGLLKALTKMSRISKDRERMNNHRIVSDEEIFSLFNERVETSS